MDLKILLLHHHHLRQNFFEREWLNFNGDWTHQPSNTKLERCNQNFMSSDCPPPPDKRKASVDLDSQPGLLLPFIIIIPCIILSSICDKVQDWFTWINHSDKSSKAKIGAPESSIAEKPVNEFLVISPLTASSHHQPSSTLSSSKADAINFSYSSGPQPAGAKLPGVDASSHASLSESSSSADSVEIPIWCKQPNATNHCFWADH
jgi:hypothetical protein